MVPYHTDIRRSVVQIDIHERQMTRPKPLQHSRKVSDYKQIYGSIIDCLPIQISAMVKTINHCESCSFDELYCIVLYSVCCRFWLVGCFHALTVRIHWFRGGCARARGCASACEYKYESLSSTVWHPRKKGDETEMIAFPKEYNIRTSRLSSYSDFSDGWNHQSLRYLFHSLHMHCVALR